MSVAATTAPAPGWYPDPQGPEHLRWWDGRAWTEHVTDAPHSEPEPEPEPAFDFVVDFSRTDDAVSDVEFLDELIDPSDAEPEPIEFSWADPEPEPEPDGFSFRVRALASAEVAAEPVAAVPMVEVPVLPVYEAPTATISSPLPARTPRAAAAAVVAEPEVVETPTEPEPAEKAPRERSPIPKRAAVGSVAVVLAAAAAAGVTNLLSGDDTRAKGAPVAAAGATMSATDKTCMKEWNTTAGGGAAELRVTLGQFTGAYAKVGRVQPLPGTIMAADSCALTVYDPSTDTNAVFVSGLEDQIGYLDVTSYPRAKQYGWPKNAREANVTIREDGTLRAL